MVPEALRYKGRVLLLKLTLVPLFLLAVSLVDRRWGPRVAGRLAGMPVVAGPILAFIALEQGPVFGGQAALGALSSVPGVVLFVVGYVRVAQHRPWPQALAVAWLGWALGSALMLQLPAGLPGALAVTLLALWIGPRYMPTDTAPVAVRVGGVGDLLLRMVAGALLTLASTLAAPHLGGRAGGLMAAFPLLSTVVAVTTHRRQGGPYVAALLRSMLSGLYALVAFCAALALALPTLPGVLAWSLTLLACVATQALTGRLARRPAAPAARSSRPGR